MPKRTNAFQQAIHFIYSQLESEGVIVTESVLLLETDIPNPIKREVDILIEKELGDKKINLAVECRGRTTRTTKDSIKWIDELIGKYQNLPVDKVIAVSEKGFTKNAKKKAERHEIELIHLQEVFEKDWPTEFQKIGIAKIKRHLEPYHVNFEFEPPLNNELRRNDTIYKRIKEEAYISVEEFINIYSPSALKSLNKYLKDHLLEIYKTRTDFDKLTLLEIPGHCKDMFLVDANGEEHDLKAVTFHWKLSWEHTKINVRHKTFREDALITTGIIEMEGKSKIVRIVQTKHKGKVTREIFTDPEKLKGHTKNESHTDTNQD